MSRSRQGPRSDQAYNVLSDDHDDSTEWGRRGTKIPRTPTDRGAGDSRSALLGRLGNLNRVDAANCVASAIGSARR